jgi:septum formation protein
MIITDEHPLILGSGSPRRREILSGLGIPLQIVVGSVDESPRPAEVVHDYLSRVVADKLAAALGKIPRADEVPAVLVADTIVVVDGEILGKPRDEDDAAALVRTRYAIQGGRAPGGPLVERTVESLVTMRDAGPDVVARYAATGEGLDKAGAYAAQGIGAFLVEKIDGSFSNVVGLPACEVARDLVEMGLLEGFPRALG